MIRVFTLPSSMNRPIRTAVPVGTLTQPSKGARSAYLAVLTWAFMFFSVLRVIAYVPTMWAIQASGDSSRF